MNTEELARQMVELDDRLGHRLMRIERGPARVARAYLDALKVVEAARPITDRAKLLTECWHRDPNMPRHYDQLGVTLETNCGTVYAIADAVRTFDAAHGHAQGRE